MGSVGGEDAICRLLARPCKMRLVSVEYHMAPKHRYPQALDDCVTATLCSLKHFSQEKVILLGGSVGGNLAFGNALKLIDQGQGSKVKGIAAMVLVTVHPSAIPPQLKDKYTASEEHAFHTINTKAAMEVFFDTYGALPKDKYTSCLLHSLLKDLPRTYIAESGADTLRDDARLMKEALEQAGVEVKYDSYEGYPHYSWSFPFQAPGRTPSSLLWQPHLSYHVEQ